jgi:membrane-associated phospholipid phosphatase
MGTAGTRNSVSLLGKGINRPRPCAPQSRINIMSWSAPIKLRPFAADVAISRACMRVASPAVEHPLRVVTWLADEKILLGAAGVFWAATRFSPSQPLRREADQMLCSVLIAGVVPDLCKYLVRRERPNRALARRHNTRVPRLGNAWDSFPSGHAIHLSAIAASAQRLVPRRWRPTCGAPSARLPSPASCCWRTIRATLLPAGASAP